uniref:Uncharacterized protein n=1 Tax=Arundo donax TaxID=35708 RepID=A0A0A9EAC5_ARUDO
MCPIKSRTRLLQRNTILNSSSKFDIGEKIQSMLQADLVDTYL